MAFSTRLTDEPCEKNEEEYDIALAKEAYDEYIADGRKSRPIEELWKDCEI